VIISSKKKENCSGGEAVRRKNEQRKDTCPCGKGKRDAAACRTN